LLAAAASASPVEAVEEARPQGVVTDSPRSPSAKNGEKILARFSETAPSPGGTRKTVQYGSYMVSSTRMMSTVKLVSAPCSSCYITAMEANLRYPDGKEANVDTGAWLHHIALFGSGAGGGSLWAAGNERPTLRLNNKDKFGLEIPMGFGLMIDLMTEEVAPKNLTLEISYEYQNKGSSGYKPARMYWLTVGEPRAPAYGADKEFKFDAWSMSASSAGNLLYAIGHMHDGGSHMNLKVGGKLVCTSVMHYNARPGYQRKQKRQHNHGAGSKMDHISDPGACIDFGTVKSGEKLSAEAVYDGSKHPLMKHNGKLESLMGNMRVYVGPTGSW